MLFLLPVLVLVVLVLVLLVAGGIGLRECRTVIRATGLQRRASKRTFEKGFVTRLHRDIAR